MFVLPDSRLVPLLDAGTDLTICWDTTVTALNGFGVPKGSPKAEAARRFLETLVTTDDVEAISEALGTAPINKAAKPELSDNAKKVEVYGPVNTGKTVQQDVGWYASNFDAVTTKVNNWLVG